MERQALEIFIENLEEGKTTYVVDTFEEVAFRFVPVGDSYNVFVKWKGRNERDIDKTTKLVMDTLLGGDVITKSLYDKY